VPFGTWGLGFEIRNQHAEGNLPTDQFLLPKIDLGGWSYVATVRVNF